MRKVFGEKYNNCSRGIRNAWQFYYALVLMMKVVILRHRYCVAHPLTRR
ncbi:TPA: DUF3265 domain-containing protein [Vibrio parahaemolyticus]|nr:DUF3265 domain-containing protein [Vibrio parahaemolyticus]